MRILILVCAMLANSAFHFLEGKMYRGSVTFKQKWRDFHATPESSQHHVMIKNIEKSLREAFKNDSNFQNVTVTQLRVVQTGTLEGIPVMQGSVLINGLSKVLKSFSVPSPTPTQETTNAVPVFQSIWPSGIYGLPKPKSGCPGESWRKGFRYQDSENVENANLKSNRSHLSGKVTPHGIRQEFCIHLDSHRKIIPWPSGKYCIYRKGGNCPAGLQQGWVRWDDENTNIDFPNSLGGEVPDGIYGQNTVIYFCCSTSGKKSDAISLPYRSPFYLIAYGSPTCQQVRYHKVTLEYLQFDDEDQGNSNARSRISPYGAVEDPYNNRIYYCYYEPTPCDASIDADCPSQALVSLSTKIRRQKVVPEKSTRASRFATGGGVGIILMASAAVAVMARRFISKANQMCVTTRGAPVL